MFYNEKMAGTGDSGWGLVVRLGVAKGINYLAEVQKTRPNALLTRTFFDAKTDEIVQIFTGGPAMNNADLVDTLNRISPLNSSKWNNIR